MRIGIDLGGTKIAGVLLDAEGTVRAGRRVATPRGDYRATLAAIDGLVAALEAEAGARASVGVGMPGALSPLTGLVKNANSTWLNGTAFDRDLARQLGRPVRTANDANCLALSEAVDGAGAGEHVVFASILGTGIGGGLAIGGRVHTGRNAIAGEWGHTPLPWPSAEERPGPRCWCGRFGCLEAWASGPALAQQAAAAGLPADAAALARSAAAGDAGASALLSAHAGRLARGLAAVVNLIDPDVIVLGGGLSLLPGLASRLEETIGAHVFSDGVTTPVRCAQHGDASGVRGAAWLWPAAGP